MEEVHHAAAQHGVMQLRPVLIDAYDHEIERPRGAGTPEPERRDDAVVVPDAAPEEGGEGEQRPTAFEEAMMRTAAAVAAPRAPRSRPAAPKRRGKSAAPAPGRKRPAPPAPVAEPDGLTAIQSVKRPKTVVDHTYRDFSRVPDPNERKAGGDALSALEGASHIYPARRREEVSGEEGSFPSKLHEILTDSDSYGQYISWRPHGRAFALLKPKQMEDKLLNKFFGHGRYSTFLRQLNEYGFKQITQGADRNCFYHEVS